MFITSLTECLDICLVAAIGFLDSPDALNSRMSLVLILLAIMTGLPSVKFEVILGHNFTKGFIKNGATM